MVEVLQVIFPFVAALGSGVLSFIVVQARMQVALTRERQELTETRTALSQHHRSMEERVKAVEADARRKAFDEFLADVHVKERHYLREVQSGSGRRKYLVLQERLYFRNIPLCGWIEREMTVEEDHTGETRLELPRARKLLK